MFPYYITISQVKNDQTFRDEALKQTINKLLNYLQFLNVFFVRF